MRNEQNFKSFTVKHKILEYTWNVWKFNIAYITDFILWVLSKQLSSKYFIYIILNLLAFFFFFFESYPGSLFFFFTKIPPLIKRGIRFQTPGCTFVTKFCVALWELLLCSLLSACCHLPIDRRANILWKMWEQLCSF